MEIIVHNFYQSILISHWETLHTTVVGVQGAWANSHSTIMDINYKHTSNMKSFITIYLFTTLHKKYHHIHAVFDINTDWFHRLIISLDLEEYVSKHRIRETSDIFDL